MSMAACGGQPAPPKTTAAPPPATTPAAVASAAPSTDVGPSPLPDDELTMRNDAMAMLDRGDLDDADKAFAILVARDPSNVAIQALAQAAKTMVRERQIQGSLALAAKPAVVIDRPPLQYTLREAAKVPAGALPKLKKVREELRWSPNGYTHRNNLPLARIDVRTAASATPTSFNDSPLAWGIKHTDHAVLVYNNRLRRLPPGASRRAGEFVAVLDASGKAGPVFDTTGLSEAKDDGFRFQRALVWAEQRGGALFVATGYRYATAGLANGFLTAIGATNGALLWRSAPQVSNATNFILYGAVIFAAYGLENQNERVFVIDQATGKTLSSWPIHGQPEVLGVIDKKLIVLTSTNYVELEIIE